MFYLLMYLLSCLCNRFQLAQRRRRLRMEKGATESHDLELEFQLDPSTGEPTAVHAQPNLPSNDMIEEWMLLLNNLVSRRLLECPATRDRTLLRRQLSPPESSRSFVSAQLYEMGHRHLDLSDSTAVGRFLAGLLTLEGDPTRAAGIRKLIAYSNAPSESRVAKGLLEADWIHHGVAMRHYTWFSSPIRRYHDLYIHRLLLESLGLEQKPPTPAIRTPSPQPPPNDHQQEEDGEREGDQDKDESVVDADDLEFLSGHLTLRSRLIKRACDRCELVYLSRFLKNKRWPEAFEGFVLRANPREMRVYLPVYDVECGVDVVPDDTPTFWRVGSVVKVVLYPEGSPVELKGRILKPGEVVGKPRTRGPGSGGGRSSGAGGGSGTAGGGRGRNRTRKERP